MLRIHTIRTKQFMKDCTVTNRTQSTDIFLMLRHYFAMRTFHRTSSVGERNADSQAPQGELMVHRQKNGIHMKNNNIRTPFSHGFVTCAKNV